MRDHQYHETWTMKTNKIITILPDISQFGKSSGKLKLELRTCQFVFGNYFVSLCSNGPLPQVVGRSGLNGPNRAFGAPGFDMF